MKKLLFTILLPLFAFIIFFFIPKNASACTIQAGNFYHLSTNNWLVVSIDSAVPNTNYGLSVSPSGCTLDNSTITTDVNGNGGAWYRCTNTGTVTIQANFAGNPSHPQADSCQGSASIDRIGDGGNGTCSDLCNTSAQCVDKPWFECTNGACTSDWSSGCPSCTGNSGAGGACMPATGCSQASDGQSTCGSGDVCCVPSSPSPTPACNGFYCTPQTCSDQRCTGCSFCISPSPTPACNGFYCTPQTCSDQRCTGCSFCISPSPTPACDGFYCTYATCSEDRCKGCSFCINASCDYFYCLPQNCSEARCATCSFCTSGCSDWCSIVHTDHPWGYCVPGSNPPAPDVGCTNYGHDCTNPAADCYCCDHVLITIAPTSVPRPPENPLCAPDSINTAIGCIPMGDTNSFIGFVLKWALGIGGGIAFLLIVYSGFLIITSSGDKQRLQAGKELLTAAVAGILLLIFSVFVLDLLGIRIFHIPGLS